MLSTIHNAFDLLALGDDDHTGRPFSERRGTLADAMAESGPSFTSLR